jgi:hypothetical protein
MGEIAMGGTQKTAVIRTKREFSKALGITRMTLWRYVRAGERE